MYALQGDSVNKKVEAYSLLSAHQNQNSQPIPTVMTIRPFSDYNYCSQQIEKRVCIFSFFFYIASVLLELNSKF